MICALRVKLDIKYTIKQKNAFYVKLIASNAFFCKNKQVLLKKVAQGVKVGFIQTMIPQKNALNVKMAAKLVLISTHVRVVKIVLFYKMINRVNKFLIKKNIQKIRNHKLKRIYLNLLEK